MLKRLATIALVLAIVGSNLFADAKWGGIARQIAMGGSQAGGQLVLNPFIMEDPALMLLNPAYQAMYKDYAWMNIGGGTLNGMSTGNNGYGQQNAGVAFSFGNEWSFGAILSHDPSAVNQISTLVASPVPPPGTGSLGIPAINNVWEAVATYDMGDFDLGLGIMYGWSNNDTSASAGGNSFENEASANVFGARLGINYDMGSGSSIDASAAFRMDNASRKITTTPVAAGVGGENSADGTEFQFTARGKFKMSNRVNFVPYGLVAIVSAEPKQDSPPNGVTPSTASTKISALAYAVGVGGEYRTADFYMAGGLSYQSARAKLETNTGGTTPVTSTTTATYMALPVLNVGGEWWFTNWLAGRAGYFRSIGSLKRKYESSAAGATGTAEANTSTAFSFLNIGGVNPGNHDGIVTLGLGLKFGNFSLDGTISEEALRRGFGVIGAQDNINTFGYLNASFNFE